MSKAIDPWVETLLIKAGEDEAMLQWELSPDAPFGFHAQQAAEKLLKALLAQLGFVLDRTHDVVKLAAQLRDAGEPIPDTPVPLADLNQFAVVYRYDSIPELEIPDRAGAIETISILREHVTARIAVLSAAS